MKTAVAFAIALLAVTPITSRSVHGQALSDSNAASAQATTVAVPTSRKIPLIFPATRLRFDSTQTTAILV